MLQIERLCRLRSRVFTGKRIWLHAFARPFARLPGSSSPCPSRRPPAPGSAAAAERVVVHDRCPGHCRAHRLASGGELRLVGRDEQQRIAEPALGRAASRQARRSPRPVAGLCRRPSRHAASKAEDHQRQGSALRRSRRIVRRGEHAVEAAFRPRVLAAAPRRSPRQPRASGSALARSSASRFSVGWVENQ